VPEAVKEHGADEVERHGDERHCVGHVHVGLAERPRIRVCLWGGGLMCKVLE